MNRRCALLLRSLNIIRYSAPHPARSILCRRRTADILRRFLSFTGFPTRIFPLPLFFFSSPEPSFESVFRIILPRKWTCTSIILIYSEFSFPPPRPSSPLSRSATNRVFRGAEIRAAKYPRCISPHGRDISRARVCIRCVSKRSRAHSS